MSPAAWVGDDPNDLHRVRSKSVLSQMPAKMRRAELVCSDAGRQPRVLAVVFPRQVPLERAQVLTSRDTHPIGADFSAPCRCGVTHAIDGARLRSELLALRIPSGRAPSLDVRRVVRT